MQRYGVFFILQIFLQLFLKVFYNALIMSEIFFDEKLGETRRNSEGCEPHGQRWDASGGARAARAERGWEGLEGVNN